MLRLGSTPERSSLVGALLQEECGPRWSLGLAHRGASSTAEIFKCFRAFRSSGACPCKSETTMPGNVPIHGAEPIFFYSA